MSAGRVVLHVGLPKTGTSFVQRVLMTNRPALADRGVHLPAAHGERLFGAVLHLTDRSAGWERSSDAGARTWSEVVAEARARRGLTVITSETLCLATPQQIDRIRADLDGLDVDVVASLRDPARQLPAEWQEGVKHGRRLSFEEFLAAVLDDRPDGPDRPGRPDRGRTGVAQRFWQAQGPVGVLERWAEGFGPDHVHVVTCPPSGTPSDVLWSRFTSVLGIPDLEPEMPESAANVSIGHTQIEVLRRMNRRVPRKGNERSYGEVVKRLYAGRILRGQGGDPVRLPAARLAQVRDLADGWTREIERRGYPVAGDLSDLVPVTVAEGPAEVSTSAMLRSSLDATAELLGEIERLRSEVAQLREGPGSRG